MTADAPTASATGGRLENRRLRVLVVDDHDVVHWGFRVLLGEQPWVERCLAARTGAEALRNIAKHADPTRVEVAVSRDDEDFMLEVRNDGARSGSGEPGMGLRLAAFEALQQGGVVESGPVDGDGWRVRLVVPLQQGPD